MSTKSLIWLFIFAMIIGGTAAGIYLSETSASSVGSNAMDSMDGMNMDEMNQENTSVTNEHANHDSTNTNETDTDTSEISEEVTEPSPTPEVVPANQTNETLKIQPKAGQPIKDFNLTAMESNLDIAQGVTLPVWTYNGTVPGQEIRVTQGDFVKITLKNELKVPVTIHWHGYPVSSETDGVPGVSQDAVLPGETYTYSFSADTSGTYWYHSHQESSEQVDKGLYGALIVEPKEAAKPDKDFTLLLDEWVKDQGGDSHSAHGAATNMSDEEMMSTMYNLYTVNGKSGAMIAPLETKVGDTVRLRFINAGYRSHGIHIPGEFKVVSTDGQDIEEPAVLRDQIVTVAPGERYDIEFKVSSQEDFTIDAHDNNKYNDQLVIPVKVSGSNGKVMDVQHDKLTGFNLFNYGNPTQTDSTEKYALEYTAVLNSKISEDQEVYTINDKVFSELPALKVKTGDNVKLTFVNEGEVDHPMHVHGHFFQVLEKNGVKVSGSIMKDTVLVKPGEKITVAFKADNPGNWMIHCHELHHAAGGMAQQLVYTDFVSNYTPNASNADNKPE